MDEERYMMDDEIDLRELVLTLLRGWKVILAVTLLGGAAAFGFSKLQPEVYEAQTLLAVDAEALKLSIAPENLLLGDHVRELAAEEAGLAADDMPEPVLKADDEDELPSITVTVQGESETLYSLVVRGEDPVYVRDAASAWASAGVLAVNELVNPYLEQEAAAYAELAEADRALLQYLEAEGLESWSWMDLVMLTGVGDQPLVLLSQGLMYFDKEETGVIQPLPEITLEVRQEILRLMRSRADSERFYETAREQAETVRRTLAVSPPGLVNEASLPEEPVEPYVIRNTLLGIMFGGMIGVMMVFFLAWYMGPEKQENG